eukprot:jgi/Chrzof1/7151/Cz02g13010.t1
MSLSTSGSDILFHWPPAVDLLGFCLQALAAENVGLENQLLDLKSAHMKLEKESAAAQQQVTKLQAQLTTLTKRSVEDRAELDKLTAERRIQLARLMQAEAKVKVLSDKAPGEDLYKFMMYDLCGMKTVQGVV